MSLFGSLFSGVSGLKAQSRAMAMISDNVANVNTTGYKGAGPSFSTLVTQGDAKAPYSPGGVRTSTSYNITKQGLVQGSDVPTHAAISGAGFFVVNGSADGTGAQLYSRDGSFESDINGNLRTPSGSYLQGWRLDNDGQVIDPNELETVQIGDVSGMARPTTRVEIDANLDSNAPTAGAYALGDMATGTVAPTFTRSLQVYDSLGAAQNLTVGFLKTGGNTWEVEVFNNTPGVVDNGAHPNGVVNSGTITFDGSGNLLTNGLASPMTVTWDAATNADPSTIDFDIGTAGTADGLTQFASQSTVGAIRQNGSEVGSLSGVSISEEGYLVAKLTNGDERRLFRLPLATFPNPSGLSPQSGNVFAKTGDSGNPNLKAVGEPGTGSLIASALEGGNADLAEEFTKMIVTQRAYSANARIITTANDMLSELIQINR